MGIISFIFALAEDMLLAAIPAVGFAMVFNVPQRALRWCALLGAIGKGLAAALRDESYREAALISFLVTLSGVVIVGVGSAFWGVVAGSIALFVQQYRRSQANGG